MLDQIGNFKEGDHVLVIVKDDHTVSLDGNGKYTVDAQILMVDASDKTTLVAFEKSLHHSTIFCLAEGRYPTKREYGRWLSWSTPVIKVGSTTAPGMSCAVCREFNQYGAPNQPDHSYKCYVCRHRV